MKRIGLIFLLLFCFAFSVIAATFRVPPSNLQARSAGNSCVAEVTWDWAIDASRGDEGPNGNISFFLRRKVGSGATVRLNESDTLSTAHVSYRDSGSTRIYSYKYEDKNTGGGGLSPAETYSYRVVVQSASGGSFSFPTNPEEWVGPVQVLTDVPTPAAPSNVRAGWVGANAEERAAHKTIEIKWQGTVLPDIGGFTIFRAAGNGAYSQIFSALLTEDAFDFEGGYWIYQDSAGLNPAERYSYKIVAFNKGVNCPAAGTRTSSESAPVSVADVPLPPPQPDFNLTSTEDNFTVSWPYFFPREHHFTLRTTNIFNADGVPQFSPSATTIPGSGGPYSRVFNDAVPSTKYAVQVCAYRDDVAGEAALSSCMVKNVETGVARPKNLRARLHGVALSGTDVSANITLSWDDQSDIESGFEAQYRVGTGGVWQPACSTAADDSDCDDSYSGISATLYYRVRARSGGLFSTFSEEVAVDLNEKPLKGWAWANAGGSAGNVLGIGWISLSSANAGAGSGASYSVFLSGAESADGWRELSGYGWSGIACDPAERRGEGASCGYGWLSFNKSDLAGCPSISGCEARVNVKTGRVDGWARFLAADPAKGAWTGWVHLRGGDYGVCLGDADPKVADGGTGKNCKGFMKDGGFMRPRVFDEDAFLATINGDNVFSGWAWGDAVGGWVQFTGGATDVGDPPVAGECRITGVRFIEPFPPEDGIGFGNSFDFKAEVLHEGDCDGVADVDEVEWSIVDGSGDIGARTGRYTAPSTGALPVSVRIRAESFKDPDHETEGTFLVARGSGDCTVGVTMTSVPSSPVAPRAEFPFEARVRPSGPCPPEADSVVWLVRSSAGGEGEEYGTITEDGGVYTAPATSPGEEVLVIAASRYHPVFYALYRFTIGSGGGGGGGGGGEDPPICQVLNVQIEGGSPAVTVGNSKDFTAQVTYNRGGCTSILDWSVDGSPTRGSIVPLEFPKARYTAPSALPSPAQATLRVCARDTGLCHSKLIELRDIEPYVSASCTDPKNLIARVGWGGMPTSAHTVEIFRRPEGGSFTKIHEVGGTLLPTGSCADGNVLTGGCTSRQPLLLNTTYWYKAAVTYGDARKETREDSARCEPSIISPTKVQVFTQSQSLLWVNWKDNDTRSGRKFEVQRLRLTPALLTYPGAMDDADPSKRPAAALSSSEIQLRWGNKTDWTPYYHLVARLEDPTADALTQFTKSSEDAPLEVLEKIAGIQIFGKEKDIWPFVPDSPNQPSPPSKPFSYIDESLDEGTTYYYRVASCSQVPLKDAEEKTKYTTKAREGAVGTPDPACGLFTEAIATTTELKAPALTSVEALSSTQIKLMWTDNSTKEGGYEIYRDGVRVHTTGENATEWTDAGLASDTRYSYSVRAVKDFGGSVGKIYSKLSSSGSAFTHFVVSVSSSGDGGGSVSPCSIGSSCEYAHGTTRTLTASASGGSEFEGWSGACSGTGSCVVSGNASVTAQFKVSAHTFTLNAVGGNAVVNVPAADYSCTATPVSPCVVGLFSGRSITVDAAAGFSCAEGCGTYAMPASSFTITATVNPVAGALPFFQRGLGNLQASVLQASGFIRRVGAPLFDGDRSETTNLSNLRIDGNRSAITPKSGRAATGQADLRNPQKNSFDPMRILGNLFIRGKEKALSLFSLQITGAAAAPDYEAFFQTVTNTLGEAAIGDNNRGAGLLPDTVYIYRVRSCVGGADCTAWSHESAGKTLRPSPGGAAPETEKRPICTRNSFCNYGTGSEFTKKVSRDVPGATPVREDSQQQCVRNADCADVGRFEQSFEER